MASYGTLAKRTDIERDEDWFGKALKASLSTRWEELSFIKDTLADVPLGLVLDAGTGYEEDSHILPWILSDLGHTTIALDWNRKSLEMPKARNVTRVLGDMTDLQYDDAQFDTVISLSVLEHMTTAHLPKACTELVRVLRPGGLLILTMDAKPHQIRPHRITDDLRPMLQGIDFGARHDQPGAPLSPEVVYFVGERKR